MKPFATSLLLVLAALAPQPAPAQEALPADQQAVASAMARLDGSKLQQLFAKVGVAPSPAFLDCMCPGEYGFHYFTEGPAGTSCRRIGPLGGTEFRGLAGERVGSCATAYPLEDGRTVLEAIAAAAPKPPVTCAAAASPGFASALNYEVMPALFRDIDPGRIIYLLSPEDRSLLAALAAKAMAITDRMVGAMVDTTAYAASTGAEFIAGAGQHAWTAAWSGNMDARIEFKGGEVAFVFDPKEGRFTPTEVVVKLPVRGKGQNLEFAIGMENRAWNGKFKIGYSNEALEVGQVQAEGKFGFEYDTRAIIDTDVVADPKPYKVLPPGTLLPWNVGIERFLAGVDFYGGVAVGGKQEVLGQEIVAGPEVTWSVKEIYSSAIVSDMLAGLDNVLVQQKALEEARHQYFRRLASQYGVEGSDCMPLRDVMVALQDRLRHLAIVNNIPYEGRKFSDIRKDIDKLPK